jgi:hypothetical protein
MPNAQTRRRRRAMGLPTSCTRVKVSSPDEQGQEYVLTPVFASSTKVTSRYLVLRNCPFVLMSWLEALLWCKDNEYELNGYRLDHPFQDMTVWIFHSVAAAERAVARFYGCCNREKPWFVPLVLWSSNDLSIFQL